MVQIIAHVLDGLEYFSRERIQGRQGSIVPYTQHIGNKGFLPVFHSRSWRFPWQTSYYKILSYDFEN
jgi:hypothetical protein